MEDRARAACAQSESFSSIMSKNMQFREYLALLGSESWLIWCRSGRRGHHPDYLKNPRHCRKHRKFFMKYLPHYLQHRKQCVTNFFFVFHHPGAPNSHYRLSRIKRPLGTLGLDPGFGGFCTFRGNGVRSRIERFWDEIVRKIVNRCLLQGSTLPPAPPKFNIVDAFPRLARLSLRPKAPNHV